MTKPTAAFLAQIASDAKKVATEEVMSMISITPSTVTVYERGYSVMVNVDYDDVGGDSYNPEWYKFDLSGTPLPSDADLGEELEEIDPDMDELDD